ANNIYGIFAGEDLTKTVSFSVFAIYNDGVVKNITNLLDTAHLSRDGWDVNTSGAATGDQFEVTFTYWPDIDEDGNSVGPGIKESVFFQVVANDYSKLYRILPVMWSDNNTDMNISSATNVKVYKLKVYTLDQNGVLENRSRAFYDTMKAVKGTNADELVDFEDCPYTYDPYQMCVIFSFPASSVGTDTAFDFQLYNASQLTHYRFICKFGVSIKDAAGVLINGYNATTGTWGYEDGGVLSTLNETYHYEANGKANLAKLSLAQDGGFNITINSWNGEYFQDRYKRSINGEYYKPVKVQLFAVKDSTSTPLTSVYQYSRTATSVMVPTYKDTVVSDIIMTLRSYDYILAKFI
ncbi:MAG: hypothetical protein K2N99_02905, partial [Malacoplasma sp.]|nr:hypothetical protein [Malacoplasma sp.]